MLMPVDTIVSDPEMIKNLAEVEETLSRIIAYEKERNCNAGVLSIQKRSLAGSYRIMSVEKAEQWMAKPVLNEPPTCEWGIEFYPRSYFEKLRQELSNDGAQQNYEHQIFS